MSNRAQTWGGRTAEQRRAERRARLVDAAYDIWGESGWAAVTMRGVCARAKLIDRYFYESFADRDELLGAVWDQVRDDTTAMLSDLVTARAGENPFAVLRDGIRLTVERAVDDPRRAQILFGAHAGSDILEERRQVMLRTMTGLFVEAGRPYLRPDADLAHFELTSFMFIGGFFETVTAWRAGTLTSSTLSDSAALIDGTARVGTTLLLPFLLESDREQFLSQ